MKTATFERLFLVFLMACWITVIIEFFVLRHLARERTFEECQQIINTTF